MRRIAALVAFLLLAAQPSEAAAVHFTFDRSGGNGSVLAEDLAAPDFGFTLFGNSAATATPTWTRFFSTASAPSRVDFHWSYISFDGRGPASDTFGYILNGMRTQLSDSAGTVSQAGMFSFLLAAGDAFGWYIDSTDGTGGRAMAGVTGGIAPVPLPAAGLLLAFGLGGLGFASVVRKTERGQ